MAVNGYRGVDFSFERLQAVVPPVGRVDVKTRSMPTATHSEAEGHETSRKGGHLDVREHLAGPPDRGFAPMSRAFHAFRPPAGCVEVITWSL